MARALLLIDLQYDFLPGGALAVTDGDAAVEVARRLIPHYTTVVATQDWHPADHASFAANQPGHAIGEVIDLHGLPQVLWPAHCVAGTPGAALHTAIDRAALTAVIRKGTDASIDSYSGFHDNGHRRSTGLGDWLSARGIASLDVLGLATDYCVKFTVLDARAESYAVRVIADGCRAVELAPGDGARAFAEMRAAGAELIDSHAALADRT